MIRTTKTALALSMALLLVAAAGCSGSTESGPISNQELRELQATGVRLIDCRTESEFSMGHIPGAENVPVDVIGEAAAGWDRSAPVAVYCAVGSRSSSAASVLRQMGFERVYDLTRGIAEWDGEIAGGADVAAGGPAAPPVPTGALPVMYEFFTET
jgi:rhodanese-related sulfurtransferase